MFSLMPWKKDRNGSGALATQTEHPLSLFRSEFDTLFDRFFSNWPTLDGNWTGWGADFDETENEVKLSMDAPGFEPGDFDIQVSGDTLRVTAERKAADDKRGFERRFQRSFTLPVALDAEKVEAKYRNGVLELTLPKSEQAKWKKVPVTG